MKIICGLGNPGKKYENTRHNIGFLFVDTYAEKYAFPAFQEKWNALVSEKIVGDKKILLMKPLTFMNKSGEALAKFAQFYKVDFKDIFVAYDDVDLPLGKLRFRDEGSAGTHNGMKSIITCLGSKNFPRLRFGVESRGEFAPEEMDLSAFVLASFKEEEWPKVEVMFQEALLLIEKSLA